MTETKLAPGDVLPNGATVIAAMTENGAGYVLGMSPGSVQPYATWRVEFDTDGTPVTFHGHYFREIERAGLDYASRIGRNTPRERRKP